MKTLKLLGAVTLCSALFAGAAFAQEGAVYSLNVVGFQKVEVKDSSLEYNLVSTPFDADDANINSVVGAQLNGGFSANEGDNIMKWDAGSQSYEVYWLTTDVGDPTYNYKWIVAGTMDIATNEILTGEGFWIRSRHSATQEVVLVGDVVSDAAVTNQVVPGYQLVSYPYSASVLIGDLTVCTNGGHGGFSANEGDNLMKWDADSQSYVIYWLTTDVGDPTYNYKWILAGTMNVATNVTIEPGEGFWYRHRGTGFDWVEPRPYDLD